MEKYNLDQAVVALFGEYFEGGHRYSVTNSTLCTGVVYPVCMCRDAGYPERYKEWMDNHTPEERKDQKKTFRATVNEQRKEFRKKAKIALAVYKDKRNKSSDGTARFSLEYIHNWCIKRNKVTYIEQMSWLEDKSKIPNSHPF